LAQAEAEDLLIEAMVVGHDQHPIIVAERTHLEDGGGVTKLESATGKALGRIQLLALVHDAHREAQATRDGRDCASDMPSPEDGELRSRQNSFEKNDHGPSATHSKISSQVPRKKLR
jgi:hypothetical protein